MTDYSELVIDLRDADTAMMNWKRLSLDAAAAIEALLKENKELIEDGPEMVEADGHWEWRKPNGEVLMPKRGEWELIDEAEPMRWGCSRCKYLSWETSSYCPRCGAKMNGEQNVE